MGNTCNSCYIDTNSQTSLEIRIRALENKIDLLDAFGAGGGNGSGTGSSCSGSASNSNNVIKKAFNHHHQLPTISSTTTTTTMEDNTTNQQATGGLSKAINELWSDVISYT